MTLLRSSVEIASTLEAGIEGSGWSKMHHKLSECSQNGKILFVEFSHY